MENEYRDKNVIEKMKKIKHKIAIMSNKGGVGKSTISSNIAVALNKKGFKVGLFDADLHGPSMLKMFGSENKKILTMENQILPIETKEGIKIISIAGLIEDSNSALIWRGPLKMKMLKDFLSQTEWGEIDYLIIDLPPGTGDEPLSICQLIPELGGIVIVTTPQEVATLDVRKSITFIEQLNIPIIGIIENMSGLKCPNCNEVIPFLGEGGGIKIANEFNVQFLGELIFDTQAAILADQGKSFLNELPDNHITKQFNKIINKINTFVDLGLGSCSYKTN